MPQTKTSVLTFIIFALAGNTLNSFCTEINFKQRGKSLAGDYNRSEESVFVGKFGVLSTVEDQNGNKFAVRRHGLTIYGELETFFEFLESMREARQKKNPNNDFKSRSTLDDENIELTDDSMISISDTSSLDIAAQSENSEYLETFKDSFDYFQAQSQPHPCLHFYFGSDGKENGNEKQSLWEKSLSKMEKVDKDRMEFNCKIGRRYLSIMKQIELINLFNSNKQNLKITPAFHSCQYLEGYTFTFANTVQREIDLYIKLDYQPRVLIQVPTTSEPSSKYWYQTTFKSLEPADHFKFYIEIAERLDVIHSAGLAHNDFKLDNILVDEKGKPLIMDFELTQRQGNVGSRKGTYLYADKVKLHSMIIDVPDFSSAASDIYSFGMSFFLLEIYNSKAYRNLMEFYEKTSKKFDILKSEILTLKKKMIKGNAGEQEYYNYQVKKLKETAKETIVEFNLYIKELLVNPKWLTKAGLDKYSFPTGFLDAPVFESLLTKTLSCREFLMEYRTLNKSKRGSKDSFELESAWKSKTQIKLISFFTRISTTPRSDIEHRFASKLAPYLRRFHYFLCFEDGHRLII